MDRDAIDDHQKREKRVTDGEG